MSTTASAHPSSGYADLLERMIELVRRGGISEPDQATIFDATWEEEIGSDAPEERVTHLKDARRPPDPIALADESLSRAERLHEQFNLFTTIRAKGARADAAVIARRSDRGESLGSLAGRTVAVKDQFDVEGIVTLAGSKMLADSPPAAADATAVARLRGSDALLIGATNMDEFAYGFSTENTHYGTTRNPHDPARIAGGSSGGSAAAVASGAVDLALGTDTNGSVRIPAAFCGVFGLRPTYGLVPRSGTVAFSPSFDVVGVLARDVMTLALGLDAIAGPDGHDPSVARAFGGVESALGAGIGGLRVAHGSGELWRGADDEVLEATVQVADALGSVGSLAIPDVDRARAAAMVITAAEGADQHRAELLSDPEAFDPAVIERFLAGLTVRAIDYVACQRYRRDFCNRVRTLFANVDVLVIPTVACAAPYIGQSTLEIGGITLPTGAVLGRFTQPISFIGLPALSVPVLGHGLPIGVQLVGRPFSEAVLCAAAAYLEAKGIVGAKVTQ